MYTKEKIDFLYFNTKEGRGQNPHGPYSETPQTDVFGPMCRYILSLLCEQLVKCKVIKNKYTCITVVLIFDHFALTVQFPAVKTHIIMTKKCASTALLCPFKSVCVFVMRKIEKLRRKGF